MGSSKKSEYIGALILIIGVIVAVLGLMLIIQGTYDDFFDYVIYVPIIGIVMGIIGVAILRANAHW